VGAATVVVTVVTTVSTAAGSDVSVEDPSVVTPVDPAVIEWYELTGWCWGSTLKFWLHQFGLNDTGLLVPPAVAPLGDERPSVTIPTTNAAQMSAIARFVVLVMAPFLELCRRRAGAQPGLDVVRSPMA
jgi:hypothetical protein